MSERKSGDLGAGDHNRDQHGSTRDTARITYERLRSVGYSHDAAKRDAGKVADQTARTLDTRNPKR